MTLPGKKRPFIIPCPHCYGEAIRVDEEIYDCTRCGVRLWAENVDGLIRYRVVKKTG